jgi:Raf kinase inhibitor-like YbhB/YbcL family protein
MMRPFRLPVCLFLTLMALLALGGCRGAQTGPLVDIQRNASRTLTVSSAAFKAGATIPTRYTCSGEDISPALAWSGAPANTKAFALIFDDPDAGNSAFTHWLLANIPATEQSLPENAPHDGTLSNGAVQGQNSAGKPGYDGPCPPPGDAHHYHFAIYALDATPSLQPGFSKQQLASAMQGHTLAWGELVGLFARS